ncbi:MAG: 1,4-alpha-glucan branching enzyme, partial [Desulfatiglandales bacterium]
MLTDYDLYLWGEGTYLRAWEKVGAHPMVVDGKEGTYFAVWAPNAEYVSVVGDFNDWDPDSTPLSLLGISGVWARFIPGVRQGALYKYFIRSRFGFRVLKSDPFAFHFELRPSTASIVWDLKGYQWNDQEWMAMRQTKNNYQSPLLIYEVHLGSWRRVAEEGNRWLTYREMAHLLAEYAKDMGFTHVEFLPLSEHPFDGSW